MSSSPSSRFRPFKNLKSQLKVAQKKAKKRVPTPQAKIQVTEPIAEPKPALKEISFKEFVKGIVPLTHNKAPRPFGLLRHKFLPRPPIAPKAHKHLKDIIDKGLHFTISNTPEYMEGTGYDVFPNTAKRLHDGEFSIQTFVDLHGCDREEAKVIFDNFLKESISFNKRMLLVIHGRGLSSPGKPVLKTLVGKWLTHGPWRKWIIAFSSARIIDGGSGATYVLLRRKPIPKGKRKGKRIKIQQEF